MTNSKNTTVDAIVIGAGTIGTATAWHLAKKGLKKVVLIERNQIGTGNTSKAASLMTLVRTKEPLIPIIQETYRNIAEVEAVTGESTGKNEVGTIHVATSQKSADNLSEITKIANSHDIKNRSIDPEEIQSRVPWMDTSEIIKASFMEEDSFVDAYVLAQVFTRAAKMEGVQILQNTEVEEILLENNRIKGIKTQNDTLYSNVVIDAAGAWSNILSMKVGIPIPMAPVRSIYWITEANKKLFPKNQPMLVMPDAMAYSRPESGGLLFGLRENDSPHFHPGELNPEPNTDFLGNKEDEWDILIEHGGGFRQFFPGLFDIGIKHCITGISTYTPDGYYTLGPMPGIEGFYAATGCAGAGVAGSGGIGRMVSEMVLEEALFTDANPFRLDRFSDFDPMTASFRQLCADARSNKRDGG